jgi:hydroxypyruvate isomerase
MSMDRRSFSKNLAAVLAAGALGRDGQGTTGVQSTAAGDESKPLFQFSIMLWTVFRELSFEQRLEKVVEAGYRNVELIGEYNKWS